MESNETKTVNTLKAHLAINVGSVEQSIKFYRKMFGIEPSKVRTGYAKFDVQQPPLNFTLNERAGVQAGAISHLGIQVASTGDVLALRGRWQGAGLLPRDEMRTSCCYAVQDKAWVTDPDGNEWEVFVVLEDNLPEAGGGACCTTNEGIRLDATGAEAQAAAPRAASPAGAAAEAGSCGCEAAPPPAGQAPCCHTQAAKFNVTR
ncbi:MAG: VOC family protein [Acidobacteriota bacterium]|nr:VOC family protein [Acidobacteriota bacterium]